jgi:hypothetical protein
MTTPTLLPNGAWTVPKGYAHPKCKGCGHNYFEMKPQKIGPHGEYPDGGLCEWCRREQEEDA